jgi:hypothetical protein
MRLITATLLLLICLIGSRAAAVTLAWSAPTTGGPVRGYRVEFQPAGNTIWPLAEEQADLPRCRVINLLPGTRYSFRITPRNEFGNGPILWCAKTGSTKSM